MSAHTPGPWNCESYQIYSSTAGRYGYRVIDTVRGRDQDELEANCALIAAAPELASALRDLYAECDAMQHEELDEHPTWGPIMRAASAALVKAGI